MLGRSVKRPAAERARSIERDNRNAGAGGKNFRGWNAQEAVRPAQPVERVRFLPADRREFSSDDPAANVMRPIALVAQLFGENALHLRQRQLLGPSAHHPQKRRAHKQQERHECRNGIAGKSEDGALAGATKEKRLSRFYGHSPKIG